MSSSRPSRIGWTKVLARVFALDVTVCRKYGGRMRVLEVVDDPDHIARLLHGARAPPRSHPPAQVLSDDISLAVKTRVHVMMIDTPNGICSATNISRLGQGTSMPA